MRNGIDGLMQSGLEQWLAGQADMREGAKKQAASRWTWGAAIALPVLAFLWFGPAIDVELRLFATLAAAALIAWWGYRPISAATQAIKVGINTAIAESYGLAYAAEVEPGPEFDAARTYGLLPGFDRSSFEDRWFGTLEGHAFRRDELDALLVLAGIAAVIGVMLQLPASQDFSSSLKRFLMFHLPLVQLYAAIQ